MLRGSGSDVCAEAAGGYEGRLDIPCTRLEDKYSADCGEGALHMWCSRRARDSGGEGDRKETSYCWQRVGRLAEAVGGEKDVCPTVRS